MAKVENLIPEPYTQGMTLDSQCWLAIVVSSDDPTKVIYFNPRGSEEIDFESFVEEFYENNFSFDYSNDGVKQIIINEENKGFIATAHGARASEEEDYDNETRRSWKTWYATAESIAIYSHFNMTKISEEVAKMKKELKLIQKDAINNAKDGKAYQKDPNAYYGVKHLFKM